MFATNFLVLNPRNLNWMQFHHLIICNEKNVLGFLWYTLHESHFITCNK